MHDPCQAFRDRWLEGALDATPGDVDEHRALCADCAAWSAARRRQVGVLLSLERLRLPEDAAQDLDRALDAELHREQRSAGEVADEVMERNDQRYQELWRRVPRLEAPAELEARVLAQLVADGVLAREPSSGAAAPIRALGALDYSTVPSVLDRLVDEELRSPAAHRAERFVGNLERKAAPVELAARVQRSLRRRPLPFLAKLGTLAAASLILWFAFVGEPRGTEPARRLRVIRVDGASRIAPIARGLAASLNGGALPAEGERG